MSFIKKFTKFLVLLSLILSIIILFLMNTNIGLRLILNNITNYWIPELEFASASGKLYNLTLKKIHYQTSDVIIDINKLSLSVNFKYLWKRQICINSLLLYDVLAEIKTIRSNKLSIPLNKKKKINNNRLYSYILHNLLINNIKIKIDDNMSTIGNFNCSLSFYNNQLIVHKINIIDLLIESTKISNLAINKITQVPIQKTKANIYNLVQKYVFNNNKKKEMQYRDSILLCRELQSKFSKPLLPLLPNFNMPFNVILEKVKIENWYLVKNKNIIINQLDIQAEIYKQYAKLTSLNINSSLLSINAFGNIKFNEQWPINLIVNATIYNQIKNIKIKLAITGKLFEDLYTKINILNPIDIQLTLKNRLIQSNFPLNLDLYSKKIHLQLYNNSLLQFYDTSLTLNNEIQNCQITFKTILKNKKISPLKIDMKVCGNKNKIILSYLNFKTLKGHSNLTATVNLQYTPNWSAELAFNNISKFYRWSKLPVKLSGKINIISSNLYKNNWQLQIPIININGKFKDNVFIAKGSFNSNSSGYWHIPKLLISIEDNILEIKGKFKDQLFIDTKVCFPTLNKIFASFYGKIYGNAKLTGRLDKLQLLTKFNIDSLHWKNFFIDEISLRSKVKLQNVAHNNIEVNVKKIKQNKFLINQLKILITGNKKQQKLKLIILDNVGSISSQLNLNGNFDNIKQCWHGVISETYFSTLLGELDLTKSTEINHKNLKKEITITPHCWKIPNSKICTYKNMEISNFGKSSMILNYPDLKILKTLLPVNMYINGTLNGHINLNWVKNKKLIQGNIVLESKKIKISNDLQDKSLPVIFDVFILNIKLYKKFINVNWFINILDKGQFNGNIKIIDFKKKRNLLGDININNVSLSLLNILTKYNNKIEGQIDTNLIIRGNIQQPKLYGKLMLKKMIIQDPWIPFIINNSWLILNFIGTTSITNGEIITSKGKTSITGDINWNNIKNSWYAYFNIKGDSIHITIPSIGASSWLDISPDIKFTVNKESIALNGNITIPSGYIEIKDLPKNVISISSDEVLLDSNFELSQTNNIVKIIPINTNLLIYVGKDVNIDVFGLNAKLLHNGQLNLIQDKYGIGLNGYINILSGKLNIYGQNLIINKGQLLFSGPIEHPYVNIEAIRNPDNTEDSVVAGIRITGIIDQLKSEIFCNSTKSQQEILSYLLYGQKLSAINNFDSNIITSILIGMGVAKGTYFLDKIGEKFGVTKLTIDTKGIGDNSQILVSGYISPKLQIKYGINIFDSLTTFTLRYNLMSKLYLEAISGFDKSIDLLFNFEF